MLRCCFLLFGLLQAASALDSSRHAADHTALNTASITSRLMRKEALRDHHEERTAEDETRWENVIWCYYEYPNGVNPFVQLNMDTWRKHAPTAKIVLVNDSNIKDFIPDLPSEYFMLPYASAKSDLLRAALLYHHGGLYMDTDFLVNRPLSLVFDKLKENDIVTYSDDEHQPSGKCPKHFSSNFMAARKHNGFSLTWWENLKRKLTAVCPAGTYQVERVCCHFEGGETHSQCHIPWASMEHMKDPHEAATALIQLEQESSSEAAVRAEAVARAKISILAPEFIDNLPADVKLYCFQGDQGMTPHINGEVYWQHWQPTKGKSSSLMQNFTEDGHYKQLYDGRFGCNAHGQNLSCTKGNWGPVAHTIPNFFGRIAYHLFFSTGQRKATTKEDVFNTNWLVSDMYRRSIGLGYGGEVLLQSAEVIDKARQDEIEEERLAEKEENELNHQNTIWVAYEYANGPSPFVQLNMETWRHHAPEMRIRLVNESNARQFIPDLPEEFFRLGYASAKSDALRSALIYHHGGLYMDTDFLMMKSMKDVMDKLQDNDVVTYSDNTGVPSGSCGPERFSSNFMAGRKYNMLNKVWWSNIKAKMSRICTKDQWRRESEFMCCHVEGETPEEAQKRNCHVPWAALEHMKNPKDLGALMQTSSSETPQASEASSLLEQSAETVTGTDVDRRSVLSVIAPEFVKELPQDLKVHCFSGNESMVPHLNGEVFWQPWADGKTASRVEASPKDRILYEHRFRCVQDDLALNCGTGNWGPEVRLMHNFFGRHAYHLFFTTTNKWANTKMDVLNMDWMLSYMYRRSLGLI